MGDRPTSGKPVAAVAARRRLLGREEAADYLSISVRLLDELIAGGYVPVVRLPVLSTRGEGVRRVLVDVRDLDAAVDQWERK